MRTKLAAISIDLDDVERYAAIHGLEDDLGSAKHAVYDRCLPRLTSWLAHESIPATFFAIGEDLDRADNRAAIAALARAGYEIGNHSHRHLYDLVTRPTAELHDEVRRGSDAIEAACGRRPTGFRAPGYTVTDTLLDVVADEGHSYDSSVFPCPSYYATKAVVLSAMRLRGRQSASVLDTPAVLRAPRTPYRLGHPYWTRGNGLLELPIGVTRLQLPYIGTALVVGGRHVAAHLTRQMLGRELIHLELHGFDAADRHEDDLHALARHRVDLDRSASDKLAALSAAVGVMKRAGYVFVTLDQVARRLSGTPTR